MNFMVIITNNGRKGLKILLISRLIYIFGIFDDVVFWINDNKLEEINWNWIGDLSRTIDILLWHSLELIDFQKIFAKILLRFGIQCH